MGRLRSVLQGSAAVASEGLCRFTAQRQTGGGDHVFDPSARLNGHDEYANLKDVLKRLQTQRATDIGNCCQISGDRFCDARRGARTHKHSVCQVEAVEIVNSGPLIGLTYFIFRFLKRPQDGIGM